MALAEKNMTVPAHDIVTLPLPTGGGPHVSGELPAGLGGTATVATERRPRRKRMTPGAKKRGRPRTISTQRERALGLPANGGPKEPPKRVILIYDPYRPFDVKVVQGIADFVRARANWQLFFHEGIRAQNHPPDFIGWPAHGVICSCHIAGLANGNREWGVPMVAFGGTWKENPACSKCVPCVAADHAAVGRLGAEHLLQRGFRQLGFCGYDGDGERAWSAARAEGFSRRAAEAAVPCEAFSVDGATAPWPTVLSALADWVRSLPRPVGLMAANDRRARQIIEACHHLGLKVPEEVAVLGVDDDPMVCELCQPTISSIDQSGRKIGREAAELLDAMMRGDQPQPGARIVPPAPVSERRSTDIIAVQDKLASAALAFVRSRACEGIKIADVAEALAISRSTLQTRFKYSVGRTIHDEMRRVRIDSARRLLSTTDVPIKQVASRSGFRTVQHLTAVFRQIIGITPAAYRQEARSRRGSID